MPGEWRNWTGDQRCSPAAVERPRTLDGLIRAVGRAVDRDLTVHAAASGHSFSEAALTDGAMIRIEALNRVLDADPYSGLVKVQAGISLRDLSAALWGRGLAMENLGDIDRQTLAGAISTATHGTGARFRNLSAQVEALELVLADGSVLEVSERSDRDAYLAARVGLGALGVIYSVTLRAVPAFTLHRVDSPRPIDETLASIDELGARNEHFEFFVFPYTDTALTIERNRTDRPPRPRGRVSA
jgi:L-gulono-1,4-lactone dehydrogenase